MVYWTIKLWQHATWAITVKAKVASNGLGIQWQLVSSNSTIYAYWHTHTHIHTHTHTHTHTHMVAGFTPSHLQGKSHVDLHSQVNFTLFYFWHPCTYKASNDCRSVCNFIAHVSISVSEYSSPPHLLTSPSTTSLVGITQRYGCSKHLIHSLMFLDGSIDELVSRCQRSLFVMMFPAST